MSYSVRNLFGVALGALLANPAAAYELPSVNLGFTSFLDGAPPAGPGWYAQQYVQFYRDGRLKDDDGDDLPLPTSDGLKARDINYDVSLTQLVYQSDQPLLFGGKWGVNLMLPVVGFDLDDNLALKTNSASMGDLLVGPFLQWDPIMGPNGPRLVQRIELQMIFPTGDYDAKDAINPSSNVFSFNPYWAGTAFLGPKWTASWRLHYLWNAENNDPWKSLRADDSQAGQAVHVNFATAYEVMPKQLRLGVNGYYLKQITESKVDGNGFKGSKEQVFGIGPGLVYHFSPHNHLFLNTYWESNAENRPEGVRLNLRFVHHFH
ncbi:Protein involved in meta-pathway of phenol degradation [Thiorhodovibrio winogradskyi]|uniref:Protein involved in meta-pathway of phenol degradation n=1 Tax=Thiorhodovibrio winogradskyi TaxID=77007 RepID=A0ABZ0SGU4_9GAMM|nr:transporter [Thiorhodovibrio winogradskyi]